MKKNTNIHTVYIHTTCNERQLTSENGHKNKKNRYEGHVNDVIMVMSW